MDTQTLFISWQNYNIYDKEALNFDQLNKEFVDCYFSEYVNLSGKKIKRTLKNEDKAREYLGKDRIAEIMKPFQDILDIKLQERKTEKDNMEKSLKEFAITYEIFPKDEMYCLKTADSGNWHTQGYGCNKYARESLAEDQMLLDLWEFKTEIREIKGEFVDRWGIRYNKFELWSNITDLDFWMLQHKPGTFISVLNWAVLCWRKGVNPKVYFPYLSDEDWNKSLELYKDPNYVITRENCMEE